jgi:hypothetical protein
MPWGELNALLVERYAFQPDITIKHQVDILHQELGQSTKSLQDLINKNSSEARLISDVADSTKHVKLGDEGRQSSLFVAAMFEVNSEGNFRFLRNGVFVEHATLGERDFMSVVVAAVDYWVKLRKLNMPSELSISEGPAEFFPTAFLNFNPKFCLRINESRIRIFRRNVEGVLIPEDLENVRFEVRG